MTHRAKASPRAINERFLWHLKTPFGEGEEHPFEHEHWWNLHSKEATEIPGTYELLRRHPNVRDVYLGNRIEREKKPNQLAYLLWCFGLRCWKSLSDAERNWFDSAVHAHYPGKGRNLAVGLHDITSQSAINAFATNPNALLTQAKKLPKNLRRTVEEVRLREIQRLAEEHHLKGRLLIAVDPFATSVAAAAEAFTKCYSAHARSEKIRRTRHNDWLAVIADFEASEEQRTPNQKRNPQRFKRYKALFEHFDFEPFTYQ